MIPQNELRVGNWAVNSRGTFFQVRAKHIQFHYEMLPIELTPEILEKAGFEFISDWTVQDERKCGCSYFKDLGYMYIASSGMSLGTVTLFQNDRTSTGVHVDTFHQLQNLIFELTGHEQQINLLNK